MKKNKKEEKKKKKEEIKRTKIFFTSKSFVKIIYVVISYLCSNIVIHVVIYVIRSIKKEN